MTYLTEVIAGWLYSQASLWDAVGIVLFCNLVAVSLVVVSYYREKHHSRKRAS